MEQPKYNEKENATKITNKINIGLALIILSPLVSSLLFYLYGGLVGSIPTSDMLWVTCVLATIITGISMVSIGCSENKLVNKSNTNK